MNRPTDQVDGPGWATFVVRHGVGDVVDGRVVSVVPLGVFVRVDGVEGFAPQLMWPELPALDAPVRARIAAIDVERRRFALHPA